MESIELLKKCADARIDSKNEMLTLVGWFVGDFVGARVGDVVGLIGALVMLFIIIKWCYSE